ncbi:MAG: penicillin-binding protein 2 [Rhodobacteraceae bacterium]|nr:penicillin-binding protein 2 [Paracoccaceae bacterium]
MKRPSTSSRDNTSRISRRAMVLGGIQGLVIGTLAWRMRDLQVNQSSEYRLLSDENRIRDRLLLPERGLIFDRNGQPLAENLPNYRIVMIREQAGDVRTVLAQLARIIELPVERREDIIRSMRRFGPSKKVPIIEHLSWEDFARVSANAPALPGIITEVGLNRYYPMQEDYSHVIGYVGPVSEADLNRFEDPDQIILSPGFQIGKTGLERHKGALLRGVAGIQRVEVNAVGRVMRELGRNDSLKGTDLQLTLDHDLQHYAQYRLAGESAAAVVMDVNSGDVRAMASTPGFDPNQFIYGITTKYWNSLIENEYRPLADKTISGAYPPGSTVKMITALAALEEGVVDPNEEIMCRGYVEVGNRRFHCWKRGGHGRMNLTDGLKNSCDVYYYEICQRIGIEKMALMARRFGFGAKPPLPLPSLTSGLAPNKQWKFDRYNEEWRIGDTLNAAIGQGFVLASPMQLAVMTARLASGRAVQPRIIQRINGVAEPLARAPSMQLSDKNLDLVKLGMFRVSNENRGTAYKSRINEPSLAMAGKTGTAQVKGISAEERAADLDSDEVPWKYRDHALFVGFAPYDNPRFAISVVIEHGISGSGAAAPVARDIMLRALYGTQPPISAYPRNLWPQMREQQANEPPPNQNIQPATPGSDRA